MIYFFMIMYRVSLIKFILWESWRAASAASRSCTLWTRREGLPLTVGGQKPLTVTERVIPVVKGTFSKQLGWYVCHRESDTCS